MIHERRTPTPGDLRVFSVLCAAFFGLAGAMVRGAGSPRTAWALWATGALVGAAGLLRPPAVRLIHDVWMGLAYPVGRVVSETILAAVFFLVVTPVGILQRLLGRDPLARRLDRSAGSYWAPRPRIEDLSRYFKQY